MLLFYYIYVIKIPIYCFFVSAKLKRRNNKLFLDFRKIESRYRKLKRRDIKTEQSHSKNHTKTRENTSST